MPACAAFLRSTAAEIIRRRSSSLAFSRIASLKLTSFAPNRHTYTRHTHRLNSSPSQCVHPYQACYYMTVLLQGFIRRRSSLLDFSCIASLKLILIAPKRHTCTDQSQRHISSTLHSAAAVRICVALAEAYARTFTFAQASPLHELHYTAALRNPRPKSWQGLNTMMLHTNSRPH